VEMCKVKSLTSVQHLIQLVAHVIISICYVVMFLLHVSFSRKSVKEECIYSKCCHVYAYMKLKYNVIN
jgi:hypothetical protein